MKTPIQHGGLSLFQAAWSRVFFDLGCLRAVQLGHEATSGDESGPRRPSRANRARDSGRWMCPTCTNSALESCNLGTLADAGILGSGGRPQQVAPPSIARHALGAQPGHARRRAPGGGPDGPLFGGRARPHARSARGQRVVGGGGLGTLLPFGPLHAAPAHQPTPAASFPDVRHPCGSGARSGGARSALHYLNADFAVRRHRGRGGTRVLRAGLQIARAAGPERSRSAQDAFWARRALRAADVLLWRG